MKTLRIRVVSADVVKLDPSAGVVFLAYTLRSPVGDNSAAIDLRVAPPDEMAEELFEAARGKAALLAEVFSGQKVSPDRYMLADYRYTRDRLAPLFTRVGDAVRRHRDTPLSDADLTRVETDGVHLLRPEYDLEGKADPERADILRKRAVLHLQQSDPETARVMAQRALRLRPDDLECQQLLARGEAPA
jgi:hypothetical protein